MPNPRAQKPLSYDQIVKDAKSLGVPAQALLDALAGGLKGSVTATAGAPADIYNLVNQASFRGQLPNLPYGSEDISKMLPDVIPTEDKSRKHSSEYGETMGSFIPTPMAGQAVKGAVKLGKAGAKALGEELGRRAVMGESFTPFVNTAIPQTNVVKNKGGNWFKDEVEKNLSGLKVEGGLHPDNLKELEKDLAEISSLPNAEKKHDYVIRQIKDEIENSRLPNALNNWVDKNLTNYVKKEMGTPEDPVRLMIDRRVEEINQKHKDDLVRANKVAQRASEETDPRKQANLQREANRLKTEADSDRELGLKHVAHFQVIDPEYLTLRDVKEVLGKLREEAGFPAKGMGKSAQAKGYENFVDNSIFSKKAGRIQDMVEKQAKIEQAKAEQMKAFEDLNRKFAQHLRDSPANLSEDTIQHLTKNMGFDDKEQLLGDDTYSKAWAKHRNLESWDDDTNLKRLEQNPYINKLTPETNIYSAQVGDLGFDHILDVLKEDLASGRLKPEDLKNISMEQAVRKTADYDLALAKKMQEAQAKKLEEMTVHKEYPEGMRWVQLDKPGQFASESQAMGHSVRGYEPPEGHPDWIPESGDSGSLGYGHGGWEGIKSGRAKVYSLVDPKGNPHTTIEVGSPMFNKVQTWGELSPEERTAMLWKMPSEGDKHLLQTYGDQMQIYHRPDGSIRLMPPKELLDPETVDKSILAPITQIKGKGNRKPVETYLPYIQDFVKSGNWGDVGDLKNTGLTKLNNQYLTYEELKPKIDEARTFLNTHPAFEPHRLADRQYLDALGNEFSTNEPVYTRHEMNELERRSLQPLHPEVPYTLSEMKSGLNNPEEYDADFLGRRLADIEKLRELHGDVPQVPPTTGMKKGGAVTISDNPDTMYMELMDKKMKGGGAEDDTKLTPMQWLEAQGNKPREPFTPIEDLTANLKAIAGLPSRMYEGAKLLVNDPKAYFADMKAPTPEEMAMAFNPSHLGMLGATKGIPVKFDRAPALTKAEINAMAERMAPQVMGEFVRAKPTASQPNPSTSVSGKSRKQFESEKDLGLKTRDISPPVTPNEFDYTDPANKGKLLIGTSGDVTPTGKEILEIKGVPIEPVEQQGGPEYGLKNKGIWAASNDQAQAYQNQAKRASEAYGGAEPLLHYHRMTDEANLYAMHHLHTLLNYLKPEELAKIDPSKYEQLVKLIQEKDVGFGKHSQFGGFEDPLSLNLHAQIDPDFRRHLGKILQMPSTSANFGLRNGLDALAATSEPELRNLEAGSSGFAIAPIDIHTPYVPYTSPNRTYETDILGGEVKRSKHPVPYELSYRDATKYLVDNPPEKGANNVFGRLNFTKPRQIIDQQFQDEVGQYMDAMKRLTGKKKGGEVSISDNPDAMFMELNDKKFAKGGAVLSLETNLPALPKTDYHSIDKLMAHISKEHKIAPQKLHDDFVAKHHMTPDTWIKRK